MTTQNNTPNPSTSIPASEDAGTETKYPQALLNADNNGIRGAKLLEVAITSGADATIITELVAYEFPDKTLYRKERDPFAWIDILKGHNAPPEAIASMLLAILFYRDTRYGTDMATEKCEAFITRANLYRHYITRDNFVRVVERCTEHNPRVVLQYHRKIAWMFAKYDGAEEWRNDGRSRTEHEIVDAMEAHDGAVADKGMATVMPYIRRACAEVTFITTMDEANAVLKMPLDVRKRVVQRVFPRTFDAGAVVPPIRNLATVYLALQVLISGGVDDELETKIVESLTWKPTEWRDNTRRETSFTGGRSSGLRGGNAWRDRHREPEVVAAEDKDPERAVRLFRWYLKYLAEVPVNKEPWMGQWTTPESARQNAISGLVPKCRKALETVGFRFARVEMGKEPNSGDARPEVRREMNGGVKLYVHDFRGSRHERYPQDGEEVIVPDYMPGEPLFRRRIDDGRRSLVGWRYEFHPIDVPSSTMVTAAWNHGGNF